MRLGRSFLECRQKGASEAQGFNPSMSNGRARTLIQKCFRGNHLPARAIKQRKFIVQRTNSSFRASLWHFCACHPASQTFTKEKAATIRQRPKFREETPVTRQRKKSISLSSCRMADQLRRLNQKEPKVRSKKRLPDLHCPDIRQNRPLGRFFA